VTDEEVTWLEQVVAVVILVGFGEVVTNTRSVAVGIGMEVGMVMGMGMVLGVV